MNTSEYDAIFWDIGGVILDHSSTRRGHERFIESVATEYGIDATQALATWRDELGSYFREREGTVYRRALEGYQQAVNAAVGEPVPEETWLQMFLEATDTCLQTIAGVQETLTRLDQTGLYLGIVSDIDTWEAERILENFRVLQVFDDITTSEDVGRTKPDPAMFETALEKANAEPARVLMVGDRYRHDMKGGTRVGLTTVAHDGSAAEEAPQPDAEFRVSDPYVDFVINSPRDLLEILGLESNNP